PPAPRAASRGRRRRGGRPPASARPPSDPPFRGLELAVEPGLGPAPLPPDRFGRHAELLGGLVQRQTGEEPQLHDRRLAWIERLQIRQRLVESHQVRRPFERQVHGFGEGHPLHSPAPLGAIAVAGMVHQDAADEMGREGEEMGPARPLETRLSAQAKVGLVDHRRGLERMAAPLLAKLARSDLAQLVIDQGENPHRRLLVAFTPSLKKLRDGSVGHKLRPSSHQVLSAGGKGAQPIRRSTLYNSGVSASCAEPNLCYLSMKPFMQSTCKRSIRNPYQAPVPARSRGPRLKEMTKRAIPCLNIRTREGYASGRFGYSGCSRSLRLRRRR